MKIDEFEFQDRNGNEIEPTKNQLVVYIKSLHKQIAELKQQLAESEDCNNMLNKCLTEKDIEIETKKEEIAELQKQLEEKERYERIVYCSYRDTETGVVGDNFVDLLKKCV